MDILDILNISIIVILTLFPVAFMYSYFDGKLNTEDCPVMNMQMLKSKLFQGFHFQNTKTKTPKIGMYIK